MGKPDPTSRFLFGLGSLIILIPIVFVLLAFLAALLWPVLSYASLAVFLLPLLLLRRRRPSAPTVR